VKKKREGLRCKVGKTKEEKARNSRRGAECTEGRKTEKG